MQPGPFSSIAAAVILALGSFWTGSLVHGPGVVSVLTGALASQRSPAAAQPSRDLADLAPGFGNDGAASPPRPSRVAAAAAVPVELELGSFGNSALLTSLARREVRQ